MHNAASTVVQVTKGVTPGLDADSVADFVIQPVGTAAFNASDWVFFNFDVDDLTAFQQTDGVINLKMEGVYQLGVSTPMPLAAVEIPIARTKSGLLVKVEANKDPQQIVVDVAKANKEFMVGTASGVKTISLGDVTVTPQGGVTDYNGSDAFNLANPLYSKKLKLTVNNGPFAASRAANAVFLDMDGNGSFTTGDPKTIGDIVANVQSDTLATWEINDDDTVDRFTNKTIKIMMVVDGTLEIKPLPSYPVGALEYILEGSKGKITTGKLRVIKDNGTRCALYNIPDGTTGQGSLDRASIRVTNKTSVAGFINGELFDETGVSLYGAPKKLADIAPLQTIRFYTGVEEGSDPANDLGQYAKRRWGGERAKLVITSNVQDLEAVATVRNVNGGPQMNVSTGATGSGCEE
jgi:hypothetical protein